VSFPTTLVLKVQLGIWYSARIVKGSVNTLVGSFWLLNPIATANISPFPSKFTTLPPVNGNIPN
jgi:hypothetical protein